MLETKETSYFLFTEPAPTEIYPPSLHVALPIFTASPDIVVQPVARRLGADHLIGTRLVFDAEDRVAGVIDGRNCRGPEKVVRLQAQFGADIRLRAAYGDTSGDREMLKIADEAGYRVFKDTP